MINYKFIIDIEPKAQKRFKFTKKGFTYKDKQQVTNEKVLLLALRQHAPAIPISGAVSLDVICYMSRPKNHYGTGKNKDKIKPSAPYSYNHIVKPDFDNLMKMLCDCMSGLFFRDDKQVVSGRLIKRYTNSRFHRWDVTLTDLEGE